jgi:serine/threonine protein phosphatase 1
LPDHHRRFLSALPLMHEEGDYLFVHAGVRPGVPLERQRPEDLLWIRDEFLRSDADHGKVIVHGHSISEEPVLRANRVGIDTGAFATGRLTCLVLEGNQRSFLSTQP